MKLFAWQPKVHGEYSFFVCAENAHDAFNAVKNFLEKERIKGNPTFCEIFSTDHYQLTELEPGQVITNDNS
jgi:hypothetical protein